MPILTPNRVADPVELENYENPTNLKQLSGKFVDWYNNLGETVLAGEPIVAFGHVCIAQRTILPGKMGILVCDWIVDALLNPAQATDIEMDALIYWDTTLNAVTPVGSTTPVAGIGAATTTLPTAGNGFILGRATANHTDNPVLNAGGTAMVCARAGARRVQVVSLQGAPTVY